MEALSEDRATIAEAPPETLVSRPVPVAVAAFGFSALAFASYPLGAGAVIAAVVAAVLVILTVTDLERRVIPNRVVLPAAAVVLVLRLAFFPTHALEYIIAALAAAMVFLVPSLINRSLMGMGDVKLIFLLGAALGWSVAGALALAFLGVFPFALFTVIRGGLSARKTTLPFGPFLAFGGLFVLIVPHLG